MESLLKNKYEFKGSIMLTLKIITFYVRVIDWTSSSIKTVTPSNPPRPEYFSVTTLKNIFCQTEHRLFEMRSFQIIYLQNNSIGLKKWSLYLVDEQLKIQKDDESQVPRGYPFVTPSLIYFTSSPNSFSLVLGNYLFKQNRSKYRFIEVNYHDYEVVSIIPLRLLQDTFTIIYTCPLSQNRQRTSVNIIHHIHESHHVQL